MGKVIEFIPRRPGRLYGGKGTLGRNSEPSASEERSLRGSPVRGRRYLEESILRRWREVAGENFLDEAQRKEHLRVLLQLRLLGLGMRDLKRTGLDLPSLGEEERKRKLGEYLERCDKQRRRGDRREAQERGAGLSLLRD